LIPKIDSVKAREFALFTGIDELDRGVTPIGVQSRPFLLIDKKAHISRTIGYRGWNLARWLGKSADRFRKGDRLRALTRDRRENKKS
jgi:hypothetical protein